MESGGEDSASVPISLKDPAAASSTLVCQNLEGLLSPLGTSGRVHYTCMDVGAEHIVFGANTGSLYFFNRAALRFLQLVSSPEIRAAVTHIRFSPDERFVALSTLDGELIVLEPKLGTRAKERIVLRHHLHRDSAAASFPATPPSATSSSPPAPSTLASAPATTAAALGAAGAATTTAGGDGHGVTCLTWAPRGQEDENYLFSSDTTGAIIITPVITSLIKRSLLLASAGPEPLYKADSRVVQLDCTSVAASTTAAMKLQLLISTLTKSILLTIDTNAKQITGLQVGSKQRNGNYGACFSASSAETAVSRSPTVLCAARPGRRIWLADAVTATVRKTLNFSTSLELLPAFPTSPATNLTPRPKLVTFGKLTTFGDGDYLLSWDDERTKAQHALCLIDIQKVEIRAWTCFAAIRDLCVLPQEDCVYVLHEANEPKGPVRTLLSKISIPLSHTAAPTTASAAAAGPTAAVDNNATAAQADDATATPATAVDTQPEPTPEPAKGQAATPVEVSPPAEVTETVTVAVGDDPAAEIPEAAQQLEPTSAAVEEAEAAQPTSPAVDQKAEVDHTPSEQAAGQEGNVSPAAEIPEQVTPAVTSSSLKPASEPAADAQQSTIAVAAVPIEPQIMHAEEQRVSTPGEDTAPGVPPVRAVSDMTEAEGSAAVAAAESPASDVSDGGDVAAAVAVRRVRTTEDNLVVPRPRKKSSKRRTARIEEATTKSPTKSPGSAAAALPPLAQVRPAASTLREILSSSSSGVALPGATNTPTITAPSAPVLSHSAPASPTLSASSSATALPPPTSLPASPLPVPATSVPSTEPLAFVTPESLADVASPPSPLSSSPSSVSALETPAATDPSPAGRAPEPTVAPAVASAADQPSSAPAADQLPEGAGGEAAAGTSDQAAGSPVTERKEAGAAANSLMSTKKWKEEIQNVGRRAMQLSKTPVNLDEIFQKPTLNFFKKSTGDKEGAESTHDEAPTTTAVTSSSTAAAAAAEKEKTKKEKEEKEKKEKKQKEEEKAKKDKADKAEAEGSNKEAKSAAGLFKRAANTLLESTSKPGTISSSDVAGLFKKAKSLVSITKFAAGHDANGAAGGPALAPGDEADDPQKAFWQLSKSLFEVLASSLPASTKFTTETLETMKEWVEEWSSLAASPEGLPPTWVTEILTACFEQHVLPSSLASSLPNEFAVDNSESEDEDEDDEERAWKLRERDLMAFLDRYFALLDHDRVLFFCNAHRLSLCISFFLHTEQILLHQTAALTPATAATAAAQYLVQLWQALENLLQPQLGSPDMEREGAAVEEALTVLRKADNNLSLVLRFLPALFAKSPRVTAQYAASLYPFVRSWNVRDALPPSPVVTSASASTATSSSSSAALLPPFSASMLLRKAHQRHVSNGGAGVRPFVSAIGYDERWAAYADYLERLVERHDECRRDPRIVHELFECALQQGVEVPSQEFGLAYRGAAVDSNGDDSGERMTHQVWRRGLFFDDEGRPRVGPRDLRWKRDSAVLRPILRDGAQRKYAHRPRRLLYLAKRYGHFEAVKELALRVDDVPTALEVGVFTDDWDCVSRLAQRHGDSWFWQHLLTFAAALWRREGRFHSPAESESESEEPKKASTYGAKNESDGKAQGKKGIQLEDVVAHMIKALGPIPAFEMIAASGSDDVAELATVFPPVAYRHFVHAVNVDIQHKELIYLMLKRVLEDLWLDKHTKRPPTIAPQFRAVKDAEVAAQLDALPFLHRLGTAAPSALGPREKAVAAAQPTPNEKMYNIGFDYTTPTPRFFEEMTGHWGLRQQLVSGSCECCTLPLAESVGRSSSLVVFECGHAFHEFCVAEDACPVCLTSHMPSLSSLLSTPAL